MVMLDLRDKVITFVCDLNNIDVYFGTTYRDRLVRNIALSNIKQLFIGNFANPSTEQIVQCCSGFLDLISSEELKKFSQTWEIHYWLFHYFRAQLKDIILKCLTGSVSSTEEGLR